MANLRFTFVSTAGTVNHNAPTITVQQEDLFIDWLWAQYAPLDEFNVPVTRNTANEAAAFRNYANALWRGTRANVIRWKHDLDRAAVAAPQLPET